VHVRRGLRTGANQLVADVHHMALVAEMGRRAALRPARVEILLATPSRRPASRATPATAAPETAPSPPERPASPETCPWIGPERRTGRIREEAPPRRDARCASWCSNLPRIEYTYMLDEIQLKFHRIPHQRAINRRALVYRLHSVYDNHLLMSAQVLSSGN
jgi:hypothetical protein